VCIPLYRIYCAGTADKKGLATLGRVTSALPTQLSRVHARDEEVPVRLEFPSRDGSPDPSYTEVSNSYAQTIFV